MMLTGSGIRIRLPLDRRVGPASRISNARAAQMVTAVMTRAALPRVERRRRAAGQPDLGRAVGRTRWRRVLPILAATLVLPLTVVAGALRLVAARRADAPVLPAAVVAP